MKHIFWAVMLPTLKGAAKAFIAILLIALVANRLKFYEIERSIGIFLIFICLLPPLYMGRMLPLLLGAPVSRNRLILLNGAMNYLGVVIALGSMFLFIAFEEFVLRSRKQRDFPPEAVAPMDESLLSYSILTDPDVFLKALGVATLLAFVFLLIINPGIAQQRLYVTVPQRSKAKQRILSLLIIAASFPLGFLVISSPFCLYGFGLFLLALAGASIPARMWVFPQNRAKRWRRIAVGIALVEAALLFLVGWNASLGNFPEARLRGAEFLGVLGPAVTPDFMRSLVKSPLTSTTAARVVKVVAPKGKFGVPLFYRWKEGTAVLPFRELLDRQKDEDPISRLQSLYDPSELTQADLEWLMKKDRMDRWPNVPLESSWVTVELSDQLVLEYLKSGSLAKMRFALRYIEFHPKAIFVVPVVEALRETLPGPLVGRGIDVLSLLVGKRLDLRTYLQWIQVGKTSAFLELNCRGVTLSQLLRDKSEEVFMNRCLREFAMEKGGNPYFVNELSRWYSSPLPWEKVNSIRSSLEAYP